MTNTRKVLAKNIKILREQAQLSQVDLAKRAKTTSTTISAIEVGRSAANLDTLEEVAAALGIHISDLFKSDQNIVPRVVKPTPEEALEVLREAIKGPRFYEVSDPLLTEFITVWGQLNESQRRSLLDLAKGRAVNSQGTDLVLNKRNLK